QIGVFVADWMTRNDGENLDGEVEACVARLREAVKAAFPTASKAEVDAALQEVKGVMDTGREKAIRPA
ncbi:MAG: hypothetical protein ABWY13_07695, partial [Mesorhizobium sp.]